MGRNIRVGIVTLLIFIVLCHGFSEGGEVPGAKKVPVIKSAGKPTSPARIEIEPLWRKEDFSPVSDVIGIIFHNGSLFLNGDVYSECYLTCIDSKNGEVIWKNRFKGFIAPLIAGEYIITASYRNVLILDFFTGKTHASRILPHKILYNYAASEKGPTIFYDSLENEKSIITAYDLSGKKTIWKKTSASLIDKNCTNILVNCYLHYKDRLFVGANNCFMILSPTTGNMVKLFFPVKNCSFFYSPVFDNTDNLYVASTISVLHFYMEPTMVKEIVDQYESYSLVKFDGKYKKKWEVNIFPAASSPIVQDNRLYLITMDKNDMKHPANGLIHPIINCFDSQTGKKIWQYRFDGVISLARLLYDKNEVYCYRNLVLYCHTYDGVYIFDAESGELLKKVNYGYHKSLENVSPFTAPAYHCAFDKNMFFLSGYFYDEEKPRDGERQVLGKFKILAAKK